VWREWRDSRQQFAVWLWIGADDDPAAAVRDMAQNDSYAARMVVSTKDLRAEIDAVARELREADSQSRQQGWCVLSERNAWNRSGGWRTP